MKTAEEILNENDRFIFDEMVSISTRRQWVILIMEKYANQLKPVAVSDAVELKNSDELAIWDILKDVEYENISPAFALTKIKDLFKQSKNN